MTVFVFDIETIPDVVGGRRLLGLDESVSDAEVCQAMQAKRRQESGSDFQRLHLHRIAVISIAMRDAERFKVLSLGSDGGNDEAELLKRFFDGLEKFTPTLVSWNGSGFDLPVIHYRAMLHGISAPRYWETGATEQSFRWNNYLNRFHERHTDLMDILAGYQARANCALDELATLCGFPGKMGMNGGQVAEAVADGRFAEVRDYCETDVLNTYLVYLRFQMMRGNLDAAGYASECRLVRDTLREANKPHFQQFLDAWPADPFESAAAEP